MITIIILFGFALLKISLLIARSNEPVMRFFSHTAFWRSINYHRQSLLRCWLWKKWSQIRSSSSINMFSSGYIWGLHVYKDRLVGDHWYFVFANHPSLILQWSKNSLAWVPSMKGPFRVLKWLHIDYWRWLTSRPALNLASFK